MFKAFIQATMQILVVSVVLSFRFIFLLRDDFLTCMAVWIRVLGKEAR